MSGLNLVAEGAARPLSERPRGSFQKADSRGPEGWPGDVSLHHCPSACQHPRWLALHQGLHYLERPSFQTEPRARELLEGARAGSLENSGGEPKITLTYTARECRFLIPTSGWMWQISGRSRRCEGKGLRDTDCYAANSPPPKAPNGSQGPSSTHNSCEANVQPSTPSQGQRGWGRLGSSCAHEHSDFRLIIPSHPKAPERHSSSRGRRGCVRRLRKAQLERPVRPDCWGLPSPDLFICKGFQAIPRAVGSYVLCTNE